MKVSSAIVCPVLKLDIQTIKDVWPSLYCWLIANSRAIGMHVLKLQRELHKLFLKEEFSLDLTKSRVKRV